MPTLYFKNVVYNGPFPPWGEVGNWFTNAAATTPAVAIPWVEDNAYKTYDLALATGVVVTPNTGEDLGSGSFGNGFSITGSCGFPFTAGFDVYDGNGQLRIYSGTFNQPVTGYRVEIHGGTFQSTVTSSGVIYIYGGTFQGAVSSATHTLSIFNGVFQSAVTQNNFGGISNGTFNGPVTLNQTTGSGVNGGTFNSSFTQTNGFISGGTFNGTFTRVTGNVSGGTFSNGIIYQFFRNGWPPPLVFPGYNPNALDVLGTGMV